MSGLAVQAPRELRGLATIHANVVNQVLAFLEAHGHKDVAKEVEDEFIRLAARNGESCACEFNACGPCKHWSPDKSGGHCKRCAHHKLCHEAFALTKAEIAERLEKR